MALDTQLAKLEPGMKLTRLARDLRDSDSTTEWTASGKAGLFSRAQMLSEIDTDLTSEDDQKIKGSITAQARAGYDGAVSVFRSLGVDLMSGILLGPLADDNEADADAGPLERTSVNGVLDNVAQRALAENRKFTANTITQGDTTAASGNTGNYFPSIDLNGVVQFGGRQVTQKHSGIPTGTITTRISAVNPSTLKPTVTARHTRGMLDTQAEAPQTVPVIVPRFTRLTANSTTGSDENYARFSDGLIANSVLNNSATSTAGSGVPFGSFTDIAPSAGDLVQSGNQTFPTAENKTDRARTLCITGSNFEFGFEIPVASGSSNAGVAQPGDRLEFALAYYETGTTAGNIRVRLASGTRASPTVFNDITINNSTPSDQWVLPASGTNMHRFTVGRSTTHLEVKIDVSATFNGTVYFGYLQLVKRNLPANTATGIPPVVLWPGNTVPVAGDQHTQLITNSEDAIFATEIPRAFGGRANLPTDVVQGGSAYTEPSL